MPKSIRKLSDVVDLDQVQDVVSGIEVGADSGPPAITPNPAIDLLDLPAPPRDPEIVKKFAGASSGVILTEILLASVTDDWRTLDIIKKMANKELDPVRINAEAFAQVLNQIWSALRFNEEPIEMPDYMVAQITSTVMIYLLKDAARTANDNFWHVIKDLFVPLIKQRIPKAREIKADINIHSDMGEAKEGSDLLKLLEERNPKLLAKIVGVMEEAGAGD